MFEYKEVLALYLQVPTLTQKMTIQERWSFEFTIVTSKRLYVVYAASLDERNLWIHSFTWILAKNHFLYQNAALTGITLPSKDQIRILGQEVYDEYILKVEGKKDEKPASRE